jgi:type II restriction enzyme
VVGLKTTCKDRWRQILNEGTKVPTKHLLTMQRGISSNQLGEMVNAGVSLVVPSILHRLYPTGSPMPLKSIDAFIEDVRKATVA